MPPGMDLPAVDQAGAASAAREPLPGTFGGFDLNLQLDMATSGRLFQIRETSGKKECLAYRVRCMVPETCRRYPSFWCLDV